MFGFDGTSPQDVPADLVADCAGVILFKRNIVDANQLRALTDAIRAVPRRDGLPPVIAIDQEGGSVSRLAGVGTTTPSAMALGAAHDPALTQAMYRLIGDEMRAVGASLDLAPVADVNNNPDNPSVGVRSFGDDPAVVGEHVRAAIRGLRSAGAGATAKHFPGHGDTSVDSHLDLPRIAHDLGRMRAVELVPFRAAIAEDVDVIMTAHILFSAVEPERKPATLSRAILTGLLREELGFGGVICTDCMEMNAVAERYTPQDSAVAALAAGADLVLFSHTLERVRAAQAGVAEALRDGRLDAARLAVSADRVRALRTRLAPVDRAPGLSCVGGAEHEAAALDAARRAVTLVRDPMDLLPLRLAPAERVLVIQFSGAAATQVEDGQRHASGGRHATVIARALAQGGARIHEQVRSLDPAGHEFKQLLMAAGAAHAVVVVTSRAKQHPLQAQAVADLALIGKRVIAIAAREPYDADVLPTSVTVLCSFGEDPHAMRAAAQAVMGEIAPQGKLPVTLSAAAPGAAP